MFISAGRGTLSAKNEACQRDAHMARNVVCCGLHEFGPYKHFTVRDVARQAWSDSLNWEVESLFSSCWFSREWRRVGINLGIKEAMGDGL